MSRRWHGSIRIAGRIRYFEMFTAVIAFACLWNNPLHAQSAAPNTAPADANIAATVDHAVGLALQGDAASAVKVLASGSPAAFKGDDAEFRTCMLSRFGPSSQFPNLNISDPWIAELANTYATYWQHTLTQPDSREQLETVLRVQVGKLVGHAIANDDAFDPAEDEIKARALKQGFYVLLGRTPPLRELMLWKKLTVEHRLVNLPEGPQSVTINYLDDFILRGWGYFATCGRRSAGGWATDEALFAVVPAYKSLLDETFSVRFIAHETQHFADKHSFPGLESWELEYRAKLTELALANTSQSSTLQLICENRSDSKDSPHGYADSRVVNEMSLRLHITTADFCEKRAVTGEPLRAVARETLLEDSRKRVNSAVPQKH